MLGQGDEKLTGRQIVVLLESYAVMSLEYPRLLENYIKPAISVLSNKRMGSQENQTFTLVTVNPVTFPRLPVTSIRIHTFDEDLFSQALSTMRFSGGGAEGSCHWAEGLAAALEVFDELEKDERMKGMISVTRHCLLVACNPPYQSVASQNDSFSGHTAIQLARMLGERNINLSVISAWKHPDLQNLHTEVWYCHELY
jgi:hypothetical protein